MTNAFKYAFNYMKGELDEENWGYCHSLAKWLRDNYDFDMFQTRKLINENSKKEGIFGYRLSILIKQYNLAKVN